MGNCVGGFRRRTTRIAPWKKSRNLVILFVGVDGVGKTTILKGLQGGDLGLAMPTVGFSRVEFNLKRQKVIAYDLGGEERIRDIWPTYYAEIYGIVYVVDATAAGRIEENQRVIGSLVDQPDLVNKPILFLLNKQDLPDAMNEFAFSDAFNLHDLAKHNRTDIRVEPICAIKGSGKDADTTIRESIEWLVEKITHDYATIDKSVNVALRQLRKRQMQDRLERQHRLAELNHTTHHTKEKSDSTESPADGMAETNGNISHFEDQPQTCNDPTDAKETKSNHVDKMQSEMDEPKSSSPT